MDLFSHETEGKRRRLRALGWAEQPGLFGQELSWVRPDGAVLTEQEAFRQLFAIDVATADQEE